eukprot:gene18141-21685_t
MSRRLKLPQSFSASLTSQDDKKKQVDPKQTQLSSFFNVVKKTPASDNDGSATATAVVDTPPAVVDQIQPDKKTSPPAKKKQDTVKSTARSKKVEEDEQKRVIGLNGRVVLPAGTPIFTHDEAARKKLLRGMDTVEKIKSDALQRSSTAANEQSDAEEEEKPKKGAKKATGKAAKVSYTPLELQFIDIKKKYPDTVLMVECGYKFKFFGEDAEIANKTLNIYSYVAKNFLNASIPVQRLQFHLRRLVHAGYKVGVVEQIETAALKAASSTKSAPFERKLTKLYTSSTFIDDENLEIFANEQNKGEKGSLFWMMNKTQTISGRRLFVNWICKPLTRIDLIHERQDAVTEIINGINSSSPVMDHITKFLKGNIPDLQRNLSKIYYKTNCAPKDFLATLKSFQRLSELFENVAKLDVFESKMMIDIFKVAGTDTQKFSERVKYYLDQVVHESASKDEKENLWTDPAIYPKLTQVKEAITTITDELQEYLKKIRKELAKPTLEYLHQPKNNLEYLIELPTSAKVPKDWMKINSTQKFVRYHCPYIVGQVKILAQNRERLQLAAKESWIDFLGSGIRIKEGRHPIVEVLLQGSTYVPNSVTLDPDQERAMIITGPNMGGKSSFIRQTSLIVIMAQVGSLVPATSCTLGIVDAIYTRMGARDNIDKGSSTFFVELQETSTILKDATPNSLVILDELGRGTSTHDGVSLAFSSLKYIVEKLGCFCLFVTHYPLLAQLENMYPKHVSNYHMGFIEQAATAGDSIPRVVFMYHVEKGASKNSYGLNVASIAGLPKSILLEASKKSNELRDVITNKVFSGVHQHPVVAKLQELYKQLSNKQLSPADMVDQVKLLQQQQQ